MFLCVMQGKAIPGQAHQLRGHSHLQTDEAGAWRPAVHRRSLTKLAVPTEVCGGKKCPSVTKVKLQPDHCAVPEH